MSTAYQYLLVERDGPVGVVTLNRPQERNALNFQLQHELMDALEALDADAAMRCIVITDAGEPAFAAGAISKKWCSSHQRRCS